MGGKKRREQYENSAYEYQGCANCIYSDNDGGPDELVCQRYPPVFVGESEHDAGIERLFFQPDVLPDVWCGEYKEDPDAN